MKKIILKFSMVLLATGFFMPQQVNAQGVGISETGANPDVSAILDVSSTTKGLLPPRMTTAERDAIVSPSDGLIIFNTTTGCPNYWHIGIWYEWCGSLPAGTIATLECAGATDNGTLTEGVAASGVNSVISYTGGNGGTHNGQTVNSTGVTGLTATLVPGTFAAGSGSLTYTISGTPSAGGTASFALNIGGQTCTLTRTVTATPSFTCGVDNVSFTYKGSPVTYGTVAGQNGTCWLDRNLGASQVATSYSDANAYGDLFQWGRGDDGHQNRTSTIVTTLSATDTPGHSNFISSSASPFDWRSPQNDLLWQGVAGTNNPCPSGWRLPTETEFDNERLSWTSNDRAGAIASPLKLPTSGYRGSNGSGNTNSGFYWCSTISGTAAIRLYFSSSTSFVSFNDRAYAESARCVKD